MEQMETLPVPIWTDPPSPTPSYTSNSNSTSSTTSSSWPSPETTPLTRSQLSLVSAYLLHSTHETDIMNSIVDLGISIKRERDEPSIGWLRKELAAAQRDLVMYREGKRKAGRMLRQEVERLKGVLAEKRQGEGEGEEKEVLRKQLDEIGVFVEKGSARGCLR